MILFLLELLVQIEIAIGIKIVIVVTVHRLFISNLKTPPTPATGSIKKKGGGRPQAVGVQESILFGSDSDPDVDLNCPKH